MKLDSIRTVNYTEYTIKLEPEESDLLLEIGRSQIVNDESECINYAIKMLIEKHMYDGESMSLFIKDREEVLKSFNKISKDKEGEIE